MRESDRAVVAQQQALRLTRFYMAAATYLLMMLAALIADRLGLGHMPARAWGWFAGLAALGNIGFWAIFNSGLNRRFRDATLTREQIIFAMSVGLIPLYSIPNARAIVLMFFLVPFNFGMLRLRRRQYIAVVGIVMSLYASMLLVEKTLGRDGFDLGYELFLFLLFGILLTWFALFGGYVSDLRERLSAKNRALERANVRIAHLSKTDDLTQLFNRRHAFTVMNQVHATAMQGESSYALSILDIDHFKRVNDTCGHPTGDTVLTRFAEVVAQGLRATDLVLAQPPAETDAKSHKDLNGGGFLARYGGEEFIVVFANVTAAQAATCLNRIRERIKLFSFAGERDVHISFSAGVTGYRVGDRLEDVIARADAALYRAKALGRDQVAVDAEADPETSAVP